MSGAASTIRGFAPSAAQGRPKILVHQYLAKPLESGSLERLIRQTCQLKGMLANAELRQYVQSIESLPPAPRIYLQLTRVLSDPKADARAIADIVDQDPALSVKVLQLVNSSFFGRRLETTDLVLAATHLGVQTIRNLVLGLELFQYTGMRKELEQLQERALRLGKACEVLAKGTPYARDAYALGLLLDVGQLALAGANYQRWLARRERATADGRTLTELEQEELGVTHSQIGAYLLGLWGLPFPLVEGVAWCHSPELAMTRSGVSPPVLAALAVSFVDETPLDEAWLTKGELGDRYESLGRLKLS